MKRHEQADMEDGQFEVTLTEDVSTIGLMGDSVLERLLGAASPRTTRLLARAIETTSLGGEPISFSVDGVTLREPDVTLAQQPRQLHLAVGEAYEPDLSPVS